MRWWHSQPAACTTPLHEQGKPLHLVLFPLTFLLACVEIWTTTLESAAGGHSYSTGHGRDSRTYKPNPLVVPFYALVGHIVLALNVVPNLFQFFTFLPYGVVQRVMDKLDDDGGSSGAWQPCQLALCLLSRFGTHGANFAIQVLGAQPSGCAMKKSSNDFMHRHARNGGYSALGLACECKQAHARAACACAARGVDAQF